MRNICGKWKFFHGAYASDRWLKTRVRFRPVRCCWSVDHTSRTKWHCSRNGYVWLVTDAERRKQRQTLGRAPERL